MPRPPSRARSRSRSPRAGSTVGTLSLFSHRAERVHRGRRRAARRAREPDHRRDPGAARDRGRRPPPHRADGRVDGRRGAAHRREERDRGDQPAPRSSCSGWETTRASGPRGTCRRPSASTRSSSCAAGSTAARRCCARSSRSSIAHVHSTVTPVADGKGALRGRRASCCATSPSRSSSRSARTSSSRIISHELRTPLTSISGALDLVLNFLAGEINEKQQRYLSMAKDSTDKLNAIVDDLLDLSKFAKGRMKMTFEVTYLDELVRSARSRSTGRPSWRSGSGSRSRRRRPGAGARGPEPAHPGAEQPAHQRGEVHARGRGDRGRAAHRAAGCRASSR